MFGRHSVSQKSWASQENTAEMADECSVFEARFQGLEAGDRARNPMTNRLIAKGQ